MLLLLILFQDQRKAIFELTVLDQFRQLLESGYEIFALEGSPQVYVILLKLPEASGVFDRFAGIDDMV